MTHFGTSFLSFLVVFLLKCSSTEALCLDSEALLKVTYEVDREEQDYDIVELYLTPSSLAPNETIRKEYQWDESFTFEMCIPRQTSCGQVVILGPPKEQYEISWDGQALVDSGPLLQRDRFESNQIYLTALEFGDSCVPECPVNRALFENQYRTTSGSKISIEPYRIEDQNGITIVAHAEEFIYDTFLYIERCCLPKDDCYRFIMGDRFAISESSDHMEHVSISFDGGVLFESKAWFYKSFEFGGGCPGIRSCDSAKDSTLEFFLTARLPDPTWPTLSWEMTAHKSSGPEVFYSGMQPIDTNTTLHYDSICVPKGSCLTFSLAAKEDSRTPYISADYELRMDKIVYRKQRFYSLSSPSIDTIHLGDCAEIANPICDSADETLLELNFQTAPVVSNSENNLFPYYSSYWYVSENTDVSAWILKSSEFIDDFEYGSSYKILHCIPREECLYNLFVHQKAEFDFYSIMLNGELSTSDAVIFYEDRNLSDYEVTALNDSCDEESSLSGGAIVVITIASLVIVGASIASTIFFVKRRRQRGFPL